jgi:hypothetical protein
MILKHENQKFASPYADRILLDKSVPSAASPRCLKIVGWSDWPHVTRSRDPASKVTCSSARQLAARSLVATDELSELARQSRLEGACASGASGWWLTPAIGGFAACIALHHSLSCTLHHTLTPAPRSSNQPASPLESQGIRTFVAPAPSLTCCPTAEVPPVAS